MNSFEGLIAVFVFIISRVVLGSVARYISETKKNEGGFMWGFILGIVGILVVGFRPTTQVHPTKEPPEWKCGCGATNSGRVQYCQSCRRERGATPPIDTPDSEDSPLIDQPSMWTCGCGAINPGRVVTCQSCRRKRGTSLPISKIICQQCGAKNNHTNVYCWACNAKLETIHDDTIIENEKEEIDRSPTDTTAENNITENNLNANHQETIALIEMLAALHARNILTDEEFTAKKTALLSKL